MGGKMNRTRRWLLAVPAGVLGVTALQSTSAFAASSAQINRDADHALRALYAAQPKARQLGQRAKAGKEPGAVDAQVAGLPSGAGKSHVVGHADTLRPRCLYNL